MGQFGPHPHLSCFVTVGSCFVAVGLALAGLDLGLLFLLWGVRLYSDVGRGIIGRGYWPILPYLKRLPDIFPAPGYGVPA